MVKGTTKEELMTSLQESIAVRNRYNPNVPQQPGGLPPKFTNVPSDVQDAAQQAQQQAQAIIPAPQQNVVTQQVPQILTAPAIAPIQDAPVDISKLSHEEFGERRKQLEAHMKTLMPNGNASY
jgi:hypothetical protein